MSNPKPSFIQNKKGQGLIEYLILVAIIAIGTLGIVRVVGQNLNSQFSSVAMALQGEKKKFKKEKVNETHYELKDLSNFLNGSASRE